MFKAFDHIERLIRIHKMIVDPDFVAIQPDIASVLGVSERTVRNDFALLESLGAPLVSHGKLGWKYCRDWDLRKELKSKIDNI